MMKSFLTLVFFVVIAACTVEKEEKMEVSSQVESVKSHCIGRSEFDLPSSFAQSSVTTGIFKLVESEPQDSAFDVVVRSAGMNRSQFALEMARRRAEFERKQSETMNVLKLERKLSEDAVMFRVQEVEDAYVSELNLLLGTNMVTVRYESFGGKFLNAEEELIRFSQRISKREVEGAQGFCLGPVSVKGDLKVEKGSFLFRNGAGVDVEVEIDTYRADERIPLLARVSGPDSLLSIFDVRHSVLRARERTVMGMRAHEWLASAKVTEEQDEKTLQFNLETMRATPSKAKPSLTITLETAQPLEDGSPTKTVISDEKAIRIWDLVVNSIRTNET